MLKKQIFVVAISALLVGCASTKKRYVKEQPPRLLGKIYQNTTARYNAFYNANRIFKESLSVGEETFKENYADTLSVAIHDAVTKSGKMEGEMEAILKKTSKVIDRKPYSKWVDDNYLLNGIAHYVKKDYDKAEEIFLYVASEYKNGVELERVGARQKMKALDLQKEKKKQAKERIKELEKEREEKEKDREQKIKERKKEIKEAQKGKTKQKTLSRDEQFKLKQKAKKEGKNLSSSEVLAQIKKQNDILKEKNKKITEDDFDLIRNAPTLKNDNEDNPGFLAHPLAAKDAMLWLAKTYITTEQFIAANAVLTAINEDVTFPNRLNTEYYLTYADMHVRLNNLGKAAEYVTKAIEDSKNRNKGRLYYVLGQIYTMDNQPALAREAFASVEKYHPHYDMIYSAKMNNYREDFKNGLFGNEEYVKTFKKMSKDAKNEDFLSEVYYFLGNAYAANQNMPKAIKAFESSIDESPFKPFNHSLPHLRLANHYYDINDYENAQTHYENASKNMKGENLEAKETKLRAEALKQIVKSYQTIHLKDSLMVLAQLPSEELMKFLNKKANDELKEQMRAKIEKANQDFGQNNSNLSNNQQSSNTRRASRNQSSGGGSSFYFYDVQQAVTGYSRFKEKWGERSNLDNWRLQSKLNSYGKAFKKFEDKNKREEFGTQDELVSSYIQEIPNSADKERKTKEVIVNEYLTIADTFIHELGEFDKAKEVLKELITVRKPDIDKQNEAQELLIYASKASGGNDDYVKKLQQTKQGQAALNQFDKSLEDEVAELDKGEKYYTEAYTLYTNGQYEQVLEFVNKLGDAEKSKYADNFAFLEATSKGYLTGNTTMKKELQNFTENYPDSKLKQQAEKIIQQIK